MPQNPAIEHLVNDAWTRILTGKAEGGDKVLVAVDELRKDIKSLKAGSRKRDAAAVSSGMGLAAIIAAVLRQFGV